MILWTVGPLRQYYIVFGIRSLLCHYLMPVFGFGCWIVLITFLHHHDDGVPWFSNEEWSYVKGQLCSIDRHYGWAHDILHSIGTHQIHHLFPQIPHYHLEEATRVFRQKYPNLIRCNANPIVSSYFKGCIRFNRQEIIKNNTAVHVFKDKTD
uniref:Omega3 fatty acid desaturase, chloroplasticlike [Aplysia californica] n=1 Tax=Lepeophtheirus salmonis TaxID=72036 RepID=A0A0K2TAT0_LEPSM